ncbi:hypothetical protein [Parahaliea mediterranea]|uniref:Uncharacterized protein n=1 Tax=Parahaliea mediterranea TaxID=651086 RepID=A0A939ILY1_9GAMM|nr:hypothetical protein [Parahaliea mediterranea]MBN7796442.1 hypothetical protein [Parahaliea mediterranea]
MSGVAIAHRRGDVVEALCWTLAGAVLFLSFGYTEMMGSDLWWHLAGGREILDQGSLWLRDTWSYTAAGERWRNHEWLSDLLFYGWQQAFGTASLVYWKWLVMLACYGGLQALLYRLSGSHPAALLLALLALAVAAPFIDMRPHLYSLLCTVVLLHLGLNRAPLWQFALLFLLWVNLHGGFIFGLLVLPLVLFPFDRPSWAALRRTVCYGLGCVAACLVNPDGVKVVLMPLTYALQADSPFRQIAEWLPPWLPGGIRSPLFFWLLPLLPAALLAYWLPPVRRQLSLPWWSLLLCLLTLAMALTSRRFIPLFGIGLAVFAAPVFGVGLHGLGGRRFLWLAAAVLVAGLLRLWPYPLASAPAYHYLTAEYTYPHRAVDVMLANDLRGRVFAYYNWGGYLHWRSDGDLAVYIDGRANTLYDDATYLNYVRILSGAPGWLGRVEGSGADFFLWPANRGDTAARIRAMLATGRWRVVHRGATAVLLARLRQEVPKPLAPGPDNVWRRVDRAGLDLAAGNAVAAAEMAAAILETVPYQRDACNVRGAALRRLGEEQAAREAMRACRRQFPSVYLR